MAGESTERIDGAHLWLVLWRSFTAVRKLDEGSIRALGFSSISDFAVLEILLHKGTLPVNEIGRRVMLTSGSITAAVDRAEKRGYVERRHQAEDRRVVEVSLTDAGRAVIQDAFEKHRETLDTAAEVLTPDEADTLEYLLKKLGRHAASLAEDAKPG